MCAKRAERWIVTDHDRRGCTDRQLESGGQATLRDTGLFGMVWANASDPPVSTPTRRRSERVGYWRRPPISGGGLSNLIELKVPSMLKTHRIRGPRAT